MSGVWVKVFPAPPVVKPELPGIGGWAEISDAPTSTYTDTAGAKWNVWKFTANGTLNVSVAGLLEYIMAAGGGGFWAPYSAYGWPTVVHRAVASFTAVAHAVVIGAAGGTSTAGGDFGPTLAGDSSIGPYKAYAAGASPGRALPMTVDWVTPSIVVGGQANAVPAPQYAGGATNLVASQPGIIFVRRPA
jgi:hypothetical protein